MQERFTLVLKGHIGIATARFPKGTRGIDLDPFARRALWEAGLDFDHGTGHGIGSYLSVHEGPQSISKRGMTVLEPGMIISNEPGYYKEGAYGIRIENLVLVSEPEKVAGGEREVMGFETLTLAPIDRRLVRAGAAVGAGAGLARRLSRPGARHHRPRARPRRPRLARGRHRADWVKSRSIPSASRGPTSCTTSMARSAGIGDGRGYVAFVLSLSGGRPR